MSATYEEYMDMHPWQTWDQDRWPERSMAIDTAFRQDNIWFTPIVGPGIIMPDGVGRDQAWYRGAEIVPSHVNHNTIGWYQRMMNAIYFDMSQRKLYARNRWGTKIQYDARDQMVTRFGGDTPSFISAVLMGQFGAQIVGIHEKGCRDAILEFSLHKYMWNGERFVIGTADFSNLARDASSAFSVRLLDDTTQRMSYRASKVAAASGMGTYAQPVPGANWSSASLIQTTTPVHYSLWGDDENDWMTALYSLQDERVINGGTVVWRNRGVLADTSYDQVLWNSGPIDKQVAITQVINWGDGAPDPDVDAPVDGVFYTGQSSAGVVHYVQCSAFVAADFTAGDVLTIHIARQETGGMDYGITDGVNFLDGKTLNMEVYSVDAVNNRLAFRQPITEEYVDPFTYTSLGGAAAAGTCYGFITKAQHVHPVFVYAGTNPVQFVQRTQPDGSLIQYHRPTDDNVDFPSVERVTANWYGEFNQWNPQLTEIYFCSAPFANLGAQEW